jgi:predicted TIM-barrel fold metal-dependent hydrolase
MSEGIVDAHHHIWRQADLPWLVGPMLPRIFGPYEAIRRDYPMTEYLADIAGSGVTRSVYVQANWAKAQFAEEAALSRRPRTRPAGRMRSSPMPT